MQTSRRLIFALTIAVGLGVVDSSQAGIVDFHYAAEFSEYNLEVSGTIGVNIYVVETLNGGAFSIANDGGLASFAVAVNRAGGQTGSLIQAASPNNSLFSPGNLPYALIVQPQYAQFGNIDNNAMPKEPRKNNLVN